ncbi:MAG TPA: HEAT repeat domain-containing protein, partial [Anaerolineae bacterium]|nr:HEAT repeat domain-containing protein [Anaerolineae bacterium]
MGVGSRSVGGAARLINMSYQAYEEVSYLNADAQRQLLREGDDVERVWAAWALGVALGAQSAPELLSSLHESPASGTRRVLLVILAGFGEREILRAFARSDPDEYVRATACQYLIRIDPNADQAIDPLIQDRLLDDPSAIVRQAILAEYPMALPIFQVVDLLRLAEDNDLEVRRLATERLLVTQPLKQLFPGLLEDRIPHEANAELRRQLLVQCLKAGGDKRLLALGQVVPLELTLEILNVLIEDEVQIEWEYLAPLCQVHDPRRDILLTSVMRATDTL